MNTAIGRLLAAVKTGVRDIGESLLGSELSEQRLIAAKRELAHARQQFTELLSQELRLGREQDQNGVERKRLEELATRALAQGREDLAEALADRILALQAEAEGRALSLSELDAEVQQLRQHIQAAEQRIREFERELQMARTRETLARTTRIVSSQLADGEELRRLRERRQAEHDRRAAAAAMPPATHDELERQLMEAGLVPNPDSEPRRRLLERLRARGEEH